MLMLTRRLLRIRFCLTAVLLLGSTVSPGSRAGGKWDFAPSAAQQRAIAAISAQSLRGHLSFIASDVLQGRANGSAGEEIAAEYIAAQFRRAGLKAVGDVGYFQTAPHIMLSPNPEGFRCRIAAGDQIADVTPSRFALHHLAQGSGSVMRELHLERAAVFKVPFDSRPSGQATAISGHVLMTEFPAAAQNRSSGSNIYALRREFLRRLAALNPALVVEIRRAADRGSEYFGSRIVIDPDQKENFSSRQPFVVITEESAARIYDALPEGPTQATFSLQVSAPLEKKTALRNVIGLLPGSDARLSDSYILLTAHYDGTGLRSGTGSGWNAANDNGSGTVSVVEIASALASLKDPPRRSLVFITFYGEEIGLAGSRFYEQHPVFPVEKTIASINLELVGRTDSTEGNQEGKASLTGFDYSDLGEVLRRAGELTGVTVYKHEKNSDSYFSRSDNQVLAELGIPAHTLCVAFDYADYHGAGDTMEKIDYDNMALTDRMIATALLILAQSEQEPRWNAAQPRASRYLEAWKRRHGMRK